MKPGFILFLIIIAWASLSCSHSRVETSLTLFPQETHFKALHLLTAIGSNTNARWSFDGKWLSFQHHDGSTPCDQIYAIRSDGTDLRKISNGLGRATSSFFYPNSSRVLFSSTFQSNSRCPKVPERSQGYVEPISTNSCRIFSQSWDDPTDLISVEPAAPRSYNAEASACKDGSVVFTSNRSGDLELYRAQLDRLGPFTDTPEQITHSLGYNGGAAFSSDCQRLAWQAFRPKPGAETKDYRKLLSKHWVRQTSLEIWTANADGSHAHQVTALGAASFTPTFTPDGKRILFSSNYGDPHRKRFDLYMINVDGTGLEQITRSGTDNGFPMFSPNGKYLAFSSSRDAKAAGDIGIFVAEWQE